LFKHVSELDRFESIQKASLASYAAALECLAQHAVEVDAAFTEKHRESLRAIRVHVMRAEDPEALREIQPVLESELRDYHDKCGLRIKGLRQEMASALVSLQEVMNSFCSSGRGEEVNLKNELRTLERLASDEDVGALRRGVQSAVVTIGECVEQIKRENEIVVAQFRDEIRTMQTRMEAVEAGAAIDGVTGALKRGEFENRVRRVIHLEEPVCLVIVKIGNYRDLRSRHGQFLATEALAGFCGRIREEFGNAADIGRWNDNAFVVILASNKQDALKRTRDWGKRMAGAYVCVEDGHRHTLHLRATIGIVDFDASEDSSRFLAKAEGLCQTMV